jgi:SAM-dependent methyltransferase
MRGFKDYFSDHSSRYGQFRPHYPTDLFAYLASISHSTELAWDCATGNGQAASGLAEYFSHVVATDASIDQIRNAEPHGAVSYGVCRSEESFLQNSSVDLVTVAQAIHWFDIENFYKEVKRVLRPGGLLAVWCYNLCEVEKGIDAVLNRFYNEVVGPFWPPERVLIEQKYSSIAFPFREIDSPQFKMEQLWSLDHLLGYLGTWSASKRYKEALGHDPLQLITPELTKEWGAEKVRKISWPLHTRIGYSE